MTDREALTAAILARPGGGHAAPGLRRLAGGARLRRVRRLRPRRRHAGVEVVQLPPRTAIVEDAAVLDFVLADIAPFEKVWAHESYVLNELFAPPGDPRRWADRVACVAARFVGAWNGTFRFVRSDHGPTRAGTRLREAISQRGPQGGR